MAIRNDSSCCQILDIKSHNEVLTECKEVKAEWKEIGLKLGISTGSLEAIYADEKKSGKCMLEMIAVWLKRGDDKQPYPTWRGLCRAIASVDRRAAEGIARDHPCQCSYFTDMPHPHVDVSPSLLPKHKPKLDDDLEISEYYQSAVEEKRGELYKLFTDVKQILEDNIVSLDRLRFCLSLHPELRKDAIAVKSLEDAMMIVCDYTSLINTKYLQAVAMKLKLQNAISLIKKYDDSIDEFCKTIPTEHIYGQDFMKHSRKHLLKSEEVEFALECNETTLSDIHGLVRKAFHDETRHVMLKVVNKKNFVMVVCYVPPHLHGDLRKLVKDNEVHLRKDKILSVTIGGFAILRTEIEEKFNPQAHVSGNVSLEDQVHINDVRTVADVWNCQNIPKAKQKSGHLLSNLGDTDRKLQVENQMLSKQLEESKQEIIQTNRRADRDIQQANSRTKESIVRLQETHSQLQESDTRLKESQSQLKILENRLQETQSQLQETQSQLQKTQSHLKILENILQEPQAQSVSLTSQKVKEILRVSTPEMSKLLSSSDNRITLAMELYGSSLITDNAYSQAIDDSAITNILKGARLMKEITTSVGFNPDKLRKLIEVMKRVEIFQDISEKWERDVQQ